MEESPSRHSQGLGSRGQQQERAWEQGHHLQGEEGGGGACHSWKIRENQKEKKEKFCFQKTPRYN